VTRGTPGTPPFLSNREIAFFGQDDWKVNSKLTVNLGLRWDLFTQPTERFDSQSNYNPATDTLTRAGENAQGGRDLVNSDLNNFGPTIGVAWSGLKKDGTVVVRGGYALKYAVDTPGIPGILQSNPPSGGSYGCNITQYGTAACPQLAANIGLDNGIPFPQVAAQVAPGQTFPAPPGQNLVRVNPDIHNEMFHQFNAMVQWEFRPNWLAEAGYVGVRGRNLLTVQNIGDGKGPFPGLRLVTTHSIVQDIEYIGKSWYDALQTKLEKRFSKGLSILSTYVWSKAVDNSPGIFCTAGTWPTTCGLSNPLQPELDKRRADFDVPDRFTFDAVYDLHCGRGQKYASNFSRGMNLLVGGWQANTDIAIQSGPRFSVFYNGMRADIVPSGTICPKVVGQSQQAAMTLDGLTFCNPRNRVFASDPDTTTENINGVVTTVLTNVPRFGNSARNIFRGHRQTIVNASLFKNLHATESFTVQLRAQAYNLFNHVNGFRPDNNIANSTFGIDSAEQRRRQLEF